MIEPTVGRVVLYRPMLNDGHVIDPDKPMAATISYVWSDHMVNLSIVDHDGVQFSKTSVTLVQDDQLVDPGECEWMPYQKGQAAKTEALENKLAGENETTG